MDIKGKLLVATPQIMDPNFFRTVVLLCDYDEEGAFGIVLNRPSDAPVFEFLPEWSAVLAEPAVVFVGGPVQPETAIGVARGGSGSAWTPVLGDVGLVDLSETDESEVAALRIFSGYAGWGRTQIDAEIAAGDWYVVSAEEDDCFTPDATDLWRTVLRRQPGNLALVANFPPDPSLN